MTTGNPELKRIQTPDMVLLVGLATSLLAIAMGPFIPGFVRGITLILIAIGVIWCVIMPNRKEQKGIEKNSKDQKRKGLNGI